MRITRCRVYDTVRVGAVDGDAVRLLEAGIDVVSVLALDVGDRERLVAGANEAIPLEGLELLAPLEPRSIRDFMTFEEHVEGASRSFRPDAVVNPAWYQAPAFYFTNPEAVVGPYDDVPMPPGCEALDFEFEVAAVVGRAGSDLSPEEARANIAGYTVFNDWSARDLQALEMPVGLGPAKGKDSASTLGPWIVTADELEPYRRDDRLHLEMTVRLNDEPFGDDLLANMSWSFEDLVAYASRGTRVVPGDVLGSGTCGAGSLAEFWGRNGRREPPPLTVGDIVTMTVEGIGTISNRIVAGGPPPPTVSAARPPVHRRKRDYQGGQ